MWRLRAKLEQAEATLADANRKLKTVRDTVALEARRPSFRISLVATGRRTVDRCGRLDGEAAQLGVALSQWPHDENERWGAGVEALKDSKAYYLAM